MNSVWIFLGIKYGCLEDIYSEKNSIFYTLVTWYIIKSMLNIYSKYSFDQFDGFSMFF